DVLRPCRPTLLYAVDQPLSAKRDRIFMGRIHNPLHAGIAPVTLRPGVAEAARLQVLLIGRMLDEFRQLIDLTDVRRAKDSSEPLRTDIAVEFRRFKRNDI